MDKSKKKDAVKKVRAAGAFFAPIQGVKCSDAFCEQSCTACTVLHTLHQVRRAAPSCSLILQVIAAMTVGKDVSPLFPGWSCLCLLRCLLRSCACWQAEASM